MSTTSKNVIVRPALLSQLRAIRRKYVLVALATGASAVAVAFLVGLSASMAADYVQRLSFAARGTWLFVVIIVAALLLWRIVILGLLRTPSLDDAALRVERAVGETDNRIISAIQLARTGALAGGASPAMTRALIAEADQLVADRDLPEEIISAGRLVATFCSAFTLFVIVSATLLYLGATGSALLWRALLVPGVQLPPATSVTLLTPAPLRVPRGEDIELRFRAHGVIPAGGHLDVRLPSNASSRLDLLRSESQPDEFALTLRRVNENIQFAVTLNDGVAGPFEVQAIERPRSEQARFILTPPPYARMATMERGPGDLSMLAGSRLAVSVVANKPLAAVGNRLTLHGPGTTLPLARDPTNPARLRLELSQGGAPIGPDVTGISFTLVDPYGFESRGEPVYAITVQPDAPPTLTVTRPAVVEQLVTAWARPSVAFEAADDVGVARVRLRYVVQRQSRLDLPPGSGVTQSIFATEDFTGPAVTSIVPGFAADWADDPPAPGIPRDHFSARWTAILRITDPGRFEFRVDVDDDARLTLADQVVLDTFEEDDARAQSEPCRMNGGLYLVRLDFRDLTGPARCRLLWRRVGEGRWEPIPTANLYPDVPAVEAAFEATKVAQDIWTGPAAVSVPLPRAVEAAWVWDLRPLQLAPGDAVRWRMEALDANDVTGPGVAASAEHLLRIGTAEEVRAALLGKLGDYMKQIDDIEKQQRELADLVGRLIGQRPLPR